MSMPNCGVYTLDKAHMLLLHLYQGFWQDAQVLGGTIWSIPHNNAQFLEIQKILHSSEI